MWEGVTGKGKLNRYIRKATHPPPQRNKHKTMAQCIHKKHTYTHAKSNQSILLNVFFKRHLRLSVFRTKQKTEQNKQAQQESTDSQKYIAKITFYETALSSSYKESICVIVGEKCNKKGGRNQATNCGYCKTWRLQKKTHIT